MMAAAVIWRTSASIARWDAAASAPSRTRASATLGLYSAASLGSRSWRIRARVRVVSALDASSRQGWPSSPEVVPDRLRATSSSGRTSWISGSAAERPLPRNPRQAARAGAAEDAVQDRLGLVVARVADGHGARPARSGDLESATSYRAAARIGLEMAGAPRLPSAQVEGQAERSRQLGHERGVRPRRLAPHAVVEVRDRQPQPRGRSELVQHPQQADAVSAARDGDDPRCRPAHASATAPAAVRSGRSRISPRTWSILAYG